MTSGCVTAMDLPEAVQGLVPIDGAQIASLRSGSTKQMGRRACRSVTLIFR